MAERIDDAVIRRAARCRRAGAGPRQPDRRAHRLQRRLRAADGASPQRTHVRAAPRRRPARPRCSADAGRRRRRRYTLGAEQPGQRLARLRPGRALRAARARAASTSRGFDVRDRLDDAARRRPVVERGARGRRAARAARSCSASSSTTSRSRSWRSAPRTSSSARPAASWTRWRPASAGTGEALFLDTRTLDVRARAAAAGSAELVVIDSGVAHARTPAAATTGAARECEAAARCSASATLRDVGADALPRIDALPEPLDAARAPRRHRERAGARTRSRAARGDPARSARCSTRRTPSMRDDYEVSAPEIDVLVAIGQADAASTARG